jgi:hypothetical protein
MKSLTLSLLVLAACLPAAAAPPAAPPPVGERLGTVAFHVSCAAAVRAPFDRGVALLHDFWYEESQRQFEQVLATDPHCAMAHWGIAMSVYHQIWGRPDASAQALAWRHLRQALAHRAGSARDRGYISALALVFRPGPQDYPARVSAYAAAMGRLHARYPDDVDVTAFHALSLLAAEPVGDLSLQAERSALAELAPLSVMYPDHPGVAHYIIHAADSPQLAAQGLAAAQRYGAIAASAPHAAHMPGHIFARLGLWQADIDANAAAVEASRIAEERHQAGAMYVYHSDEFLLYAYLQAAQDAAARRIVADGAALIAHDTAMPGMVDSSMADVLPYYRAEYPAFLALELRDWPAAAALEPVAADPAESQLLTLWARTIADGHLRHAAAAAADLAAYEAQRAALAKGRYAYALQGNGAAIQYGEVQAWAAFAAGHDADALQAMRGSADLQDRVGQGEVDIPAREMLADMLLDLGRPDEALAEYQRALQLSPQRFNGLYNAGRAAEALHDRAQATTYYAALMRSTGNGALSTRAEFDQVRAFLAAP